MRSLITLTTDFGEGSPYVAQMKGVLLSICREVDLLDISHSIRPQDTRQGALVLADATPRFPAGTIHLGVIDPGVGTSRRILFAEIAGQRYIAPDNGLLSGLTLKLEPARLIAIENASHWLPQRSHTFHGRDIMAPVAARLASGLAPDQLGPVVNEFVKLDWPPVLRTTSQVQGQVLLADSFGNLITNIGQRDLERLGELHTLSIRCGGQRIEGVVTTYGAALLGEVVALLDSQDRLEIAVVGGNAARDLGAGPGDAVVVSAE